MVLVQISRKLDARIRLPSEKWHHSPAKLGINLNLHQSPASPTRTNRLLLADHGDNGVNFASGWSPACD
jgi:hypothetical protein